MDRWCRCAFSCIPFSQMWYATCGWNSLTSIEERGALYWKPRENIFYLVGKSRELPLISSVKDYSDPAIRSLRGEGLLGDERVGIRRELKFPGDSNPISVTVPTRFPRIPPRTDRLIRFLQLLHGITALSAKLFWNHVYDANGLGERPVGRLIFLFDNESAFRNLFARPTEHLGGIGHSRVIQWSLRDDYAAFSRRPRRFLTTLLRRKLIFALNVLSFAPLISNLLQEAAASSPRGEANSAVINNARLINVALIIEEIFQLCSLLSR